MLLYFSKLPAKVCKPSFQKTPLNGERCVLFRKEHTLPSREQSKLGKGHDLQQISQSF